MASAPPNQECGHCLDGSHGLSEGLELEIVLLAATMPFGSTTLTMAEEHGQIYLITIRTDKDGYGRSYVSMSPDGAELLQQRLGPAIKKAREFLKENAVKKEEKK